MVAGSVFRPIALSARSTLDIDLSLEHGQNLILVFPFRRANVSRSHASWFCQWIYKQSNFKSEALYVRSNASPIAGAPGLDKRHAQRLGALKMQSEIRRFRQIFSLAIQHHSFRSWPLSRMATLDFYGHRRRWRLANRHWKHEIGSAFESPRRMLLEDRNISTRHTHQDLLLGPPWLTFFKPLQYNYTMQAAFFGILCHLNQRVG